MIFLKNEPKQRKNAIEDLISFLTNPGRFSILVLGDRGTGKSHWIKKIALHYKEKDCLGKIVSINSLTINDKTEDYWDVKFKEADQGLLVIKDVEKLNNQTQAMLFEFLSTTNGKYGLNEKNFTCRIIFTSTFSIETLRDTEEFLSHYFFDRIAQLVTRFPSFSETDRSIWNDFKTTWDKMEFPKEDFPNNFQSWIESNSQKLHGNFRDLDKLAINWRNYQLRKGFNDDDILKKVTSDFTSYFHFPEHKSELNDNYYIKENIDWNDNLNNFRLVYKNWIKNKYGSLRKGEKFAKVSHRTMERW